MADWRKKVLDFMQEKNISRGELEKLINENGGQIKQSGLAHWFNSTPKRKESKPNTRNGLALIKVMDAKLTLDEIYNSN